MTAAASMPLLANTYFEQALGVSLHALLAPVRNDSPAGSRVKGTPIYNAIQQARRQDDASLPPGIWGWELKRPDWRQVGALCGHFLHCQGKDLEAARHLFEAQLHIDGFAAIAPCLMLLDGLLNQYWQTLHPQAQGGDLELRANHFWWIGEKLLPVLRLTPVTASDTTPQYTWSDREQARRNAQLVMQLTAHNATSQPAGADFIEGMTLASFEQGVAASSTGHFQQLQRELSEALAALATLEVTMDSHFGDASPGLPRMRSMLEQLLAFADGELHQRGVHVIPSQ